MKRLKDRVALITGASAGIGQATAKLFAQEGASVVAIARRGKPLKELEKEHGNIEGFPCDLQDHEALQKCVDQTIRRHKKIDVLINVAGFSYYKRFVDSTLEQWHHTMRVNMDAMSVLAKPVVPHMINNQYGRIVNTSSIQSFYCSNWVGAYAASKGAIESWTRTLAIDLAEYNILANVISPGCTHTEMSVVGGVDETTTDEFKEEFVIKRKIPLARAADPVEVSRPILHLASDENTYITGQCLVVDGGLTINLGYCESSI
jgi:NAD(P)-dependent dehydrogenase (short-subunit alcohol dehydrogenase family)